MIRSDVAFGCGGNRDGKRDTIKEAPMHINRKIERFLRNHHFPPTKFGRVIAGDPRLVLDMRQGRRLGPRLVARAETFMTRYVEDLAAQDCSQ